MEELLARFSTPDADPTDLFTRLIDEIRPRRPTDFVTAKRNLQALCHIIGLHPELRRAVSEKLVKLSQTHRHSELYTSTGILPNTSFLSESLRRIGHSILPEALDKDLLRNALRKIFHRPSDGRWVSGVGEQAWLKLDEALHFEERSASPEMPRAIAEIIRSLRVISYWIASFGMEPELLRHDRALETYESPFVTQNEELIAYIDAYPGAWRKPDAAISDDRHLRVSTNVCKSSKNTQARGPGRHQHPPHLSCSTSATIDFAL